MCVCVCVCKYVCVHGACVCVMSMYVVKVTTLHNGKHSWLEISREHRSY